MMKMPQTRLKKQFFVIFIAVITVLFGKSTVFASENYIGIPNVSVHIGGVSETEEGNEGSVPASDTVQLLFLITIISLAPSMLIMLTCFTRIIIVLHFVRSALGTQQMPPNQILIGIAVFLTLFIMRPAFTEINENAIKPYAAKEITQKEMIDNAMAPIREFMFHQVEDKDLALFSELSQQTYASKEEIPNTVLIPSFILGELTKGFITGFFIYIPFIVIDMIVASILMAMGMMMLPPAMISLPFKVLLFIMVDGWSYIIQIVAMGFR